MEETVGVEPTNNGFAVRRLEPLGYVSPPSAHARFPILMERALRVKHHYIYQNSSISGILRMKKPAPHFMRRGFACDSSQPGSALFIQEPALADARDFAGCRRLSRGRR